MRIAASSILIVLNAEPDVPNGTESSMYPDEWNNYGDCNEPNPNGPRTDYDLPSSEVPVWGPNWVNEGVGFATPTTTNTTLVGLGAVTVIAFLTPIPGDEIAAVSALLLAF